ncbi:hypothetical protein GUITHDRAFT_46290, partial [Guillardia theta CCMP2712]
QLYKDCLRLLQHISATHRSVDARQVKVLVKNEFKKNAFVTDQSKLDNLKKNALQAVTNYVMHISG